MSSLKKIFTTVGGVLVILIILGMAIQSCESNETCDVINKNQCQFESTCKPLLFDIVLNIF
jgi:hypothetical protein